MHHCNCIYCVIPNELKLIINKTGWIDFLEFLNCTLFDSWSNFQIIIRLSVDDVINFYVDVKLLKKRQKNVNKQTGW